MYPYERSLVEKHKDEPFAMIGVNSDAAPNALEKALKDEKINWRSFRDAFPINSIAKRWNVSAWPTIYLLDWTGKIRSKNIRGQGLGRSIDLLLAEQAGKGELGSEAYARHGDGSVMWSGTPRGTVQIRRNRRLPAHEGWCLNSIEPEELAHTSHRHGEVLERGRELQLKAKK